MDLAATLYLGVTFGLFVIFVGIVMRTYGRKNRDKNETAKYRMLDDD